jgi:ribosome biogenesis GTPase A
MIPVLNVSKKVLRSSVSLCHSTHLRKTVEVRIGGGGGVAESSANTNTRTLSLSKVESSAAQNENYESRLLKIAIIGVPNAGKSTIINQLVGRKVNIRRS